MKSTLLLLILLSIVTCSFGQKKQRLIAQAEYFGSTLQDSATFSYSGSRHSEFDYNILDYVNLRNTFANQYDGSAVERVNSIVIPNNIDSGGHTLNVWFDTLRWYHANSNSGQMPNWTTEAISYWPDGKPASTYHQYGSIVRNSAFLYYFNRLLRRQAEFHNSIAAYSDEQFYTYDAYENMVVDSCYRHDPPNSGVYWVNTYSFDSIGQYTSRRPFINQRYSYCYSSDGRVNEMITFSADVPYVPKRCDSFFYTLGVAGYTRRASYNILNGKVYPIPFDQVNFHVNILGQKDTMVVTGLNGYYNIVALTYNKYGYPEIRTNDLYSSGGVKVSRITTYYYYEFYNSELSVEYTRMPNSPIAHFPNPTTGPLTLRNIPNESIIVSISNTLGQLVHVQSLHAQGNTVQITLNNQLALGVYNITVKGTNHSVLYRSTFLKQ